MENEKMFDSGREQGEEDPKELTPEEIEQIVINVPLENMEPLPEEIKKKIKELKRKWEEEHK